MIYRTSVVLVLAAVLAFAPGAGVAAADGCQTCLPPLSVPDTGSPARGSVDTGHLLGSYLNEKVLKENAGIAAHEQHKQALQAEVQAENGKIAAHNEKVTAADAKTEAWNGKADGFNARAGALSAKINAHNAEPHEFQIPEQEAAAEAYDAETAELNSEQNQLKAEGAALDGEKSQLATEKSTLDNEGSQLDAEKQQLRKKIDAYAKEGSELAAESQQLLEEVMSELQSELQPAEQEQAPGGDSVRAGNEGGIADDGGDPVSRKTDGEALDRYAENNGVVVDKKPVRALLTPETVAGASAEESTQLAPTRIYDGLVRKPDGTYKALEIQTAPGPQPFNDAISHGGQATAVVDGKKITIDEVATVPVKPGSPAPKMPSAPAVAPEVMTLLTTTAAPGHDHVPLGPLPAGLVSPRPWENDGGTDTKRAPKRKPDRCTENWSDYGEREEVRTPDGFRYRATGAEACVVTVAPPGRPDLNFPVPGLRTDEGMARCHLIGHQLGGSDTDLGNFVPCYQDPTNNKWMSGLVENKIAGKVKAGDPVYMVVRPIYRGQDPLPVGIAVHAQANSGWSCSTFIPNVTEQQAVSGGIPFFGC